MAITPLPDAPSPSDTAAQFNSKAFAFVAALDQFTTEANALAVEADADASTASAGASTATTQAGIATTQAGIATTQAGIAATKAGEALASANAAAASFDSFDDRYLGAKGSDPTLDNDGNALLVGATYFNSSLMEMRVWSGLAWVASSFVPTASSAVTYTPAGTGAVATTVQSKLRESVSVADFGTTALTALNTAATELSAGGLLHLPKATYTLSDKFTFAGQRLNIEGDGQNVSVISYSPASTGIAFEYNNPATGGLYQGSIKNLGFSSGNSVNKTAIVLYNTADCELHGIGISSGAWAGTGSIGIRTYGRQTLSIRNCQIACARPLVFSQNPAFTSLNTDHYLVEHCELSTTLSTGACIEFENGVMHTSTTLRNLALTGGKWGILWNDTTSVGASYALAIENIRTEQPADATGWSIDLQSTSFALQTVSIKNAYLASGYNGIRLRNAQLITLENVYFTQSSGTQLDVTLIAGSRLVLINCFFQTGGTKTITNGRCVRRGMAATGHTVEEWVFDNAAFDGGEYSDTYHHGSPVSVTNGGTILLGSASNSTGFVFITTSEDVSAIFLLAGPTALTREVSDPLGFFSITKGTASSYNIYHESGNYFLENNRGLTATVSVFKMLTTA